MKVRSSCSRRELQPQEESTLLVLWTIESYEELEDLEKHMTQCSGEEHWQDRCAILERIACLQERQAELGFEN